MEVRLGRMGNDRLGKDWMVLLLMLGSLRMLMMKRNVRNDVDEERGLSFVLIDDDGWGIERWMWMCGNGNGLWEGKWVEWVMLVVEVISISLVIPVNIDRQYSSREEGTSEG